MYQIGVSSCGFPLSEENFQKLAKNGIKNIEMSMRLEMHQTLDHKKMLELSRRYGIKLWSYHLPFAPFEVIDISSENREIREYAMRLDEELIKKGADIGIDKFVIHASGEPITPDKREERIKYSMQSLDALAELAHRHGAVVCVEDLPRTCLGNTAAEVQRLLGANDKLRVCFDTNHLLTDSNVDFMKTLSDKIVTLHVSDYDRLDEAHWLPGEGVINWAEMLSTLQEIGYRGVWMYEIHLNPPKSLSRSRNLVFEDFVENAAALFGGKPFPRVS